MPMKPTSCLLILVLSLATYTACNRSGETSRPSGENRAVLGAEVDYGVIIVDSNGSRIQQFPARRSGSDRIDVSYFWPYVVNSGTAVLMVRCHGLQKEYGFLQPGTRAQGGCDLVEGDIASGSETVILKHTEKEFLNSPVPHPSEDSVVVIRGQEILGISYPSGGRAFSIPVPEFRDFAPWDPRGLRPYLRWDESGQTLYIAGMRSHSHQRRGGLIDVGVVSFESDRVAWMPLATPVFLYGKHDRDYFVQNGDTLIPRKLSMKPEPAFLALFGDVHNPVLEPIFTEDRRYYFYVTRKEGFLARQWIEGYDRNSNATFEVRTLWRHLYVE